MRLGPKMVLGDAFQSGSVWLNSRAMALST
jgi:hypothetical protein